MKKDSVGVGLMGLGTIGTQVARVLAEKPEVLAEHVGVPVILRKVKVRDVSRARARANWLALELLTTDDDEFFRTPGLDIIVELVGGEHPAYEYIKRAIKNHCHVVTANKEVIAKHLAELRGLSQKHDVWLRFGASVGGGIPLISPFHFDLAANRIKSIRAIINGTTNFILTQMEKDGAEFQDALKEAQRRGYAEADPKNDIEGIDAAYKLAILASLASHKHVKPEDVYHEGISRITSHDFRYARELGFAIKLLAIAKDDGDSIEARVHPVFIPEDSMLASVNDVYNAIMVEGDLVGNVLFFGRGAGPLPTASTVVADIITEAQDIRLGVGNRTRWQMAKSAPIKPMSKIETRYYFRMRLVDRSGVLAQIARVFGSNRVSIASVIQKETDNSSQTAEIVLMTHTASEKAVQQTLKKLKSLPAVKEIGNFIRVEA